MQPRIETSWEGWKHANRNNPISRAYIPPPPIPTLSERLESKMRDLKEYAKNNLFILGVMGIGLAGFFCYGLNHATTPIK